MKSISWCVLIFLIVILFIGVVCWGHSVQRRKITEKIDDFLNLKNSYKEKMDILIPKDSQELYYDEMTDDFMREAMINHQNANEKIAQIKWKLVEIENLNRLNKLMDKANSHLHILDLEELKNTLEKLYEIYGFERQEVRKAYVVDVAIEFEYKNKGKATYTYYMTVYKYKNEWYIYVPLGITT